jgi:hypothetical protein
MNVLDSTLSHIRDDAGFNEGRVDATIAVWCNGNLIRNEIC